MFELSCHLYKLPMINNPLYVWIFVKVYRTQMVCTGLHKNVDLIIEKKNQRIKQLYENEILQSFLVIKL